MTETAEPTHQEVAERWSRFDPEMKGMYAEATVVKVDRGTDLGIVSTIIGGVGFLISFALTVADWWVPAVLGIGALVVALVAIIGKGWRSKWWLGAGITLGLICLFFGIVSKRAYDDAVSQINCAADADTLQEIVDCGP